MLILGFGAFFTFGCLLVVVGAYQPQLAAALDIGLREIGMLGSAMVAGIGLGVLSAGPFVDRHSGRPLFAGAVGITALAFLLVGDSMSALRAGAHLFAAGFGAGFYETVLNAAVASRYGDASVRRLAFIHSAATLGGMLAPLGIVAWIARGGDFVDGFRLIGALHLCVAVWGLMSPALAGPPASHAVNAQTAQPRMADWITRPAVLALLCCAFFYVGGETALTLFAVPYSQDALGLSPDRGRTAISAFWMGLLAMRIIVILSPRQPGAGMVFWSTTLGAIVLGLGVAFQLSAIELLLGSVGLAMGALFPLFVAIAGQAVPEARGSAISMVAGLGAGGGFIVPWVLGVVGDAAGTRAVMIGATAGLGLAAISGFVLMRAMRTSRDDPDHTGPGTEANLAQ